MSGIDRRRSIINRKNLTGESKHVAGVGRGNSNYAKRHKFSNHYSSLQIDNKPNFGSQGKRKIKVSLAPVKGLEKE